MKKCLALAILTAFAFAIAPRTTDAQFRYYSAPRVYYTPPVYVPYGGYSYNLAPGFNYGYGDPYPSGLYYQGRGFTYRYGQPRLYGGFGNNSVYSNYRWNRYRRW